jgi:hypothetical protein
MKTHKGPLFIHFEKPRPGKAPAEGAVTTMLLGEEAADAPPPEPSPPFGPPVTTMMVGEEDGKP